MKSNLLIYITVIAAVSISMWVIFSKNPSQSLTSPFAAAQTPSSPAPSSSPSPQTFTYDKSTDLKKELNTINPEIKANDFNDLRQISQSL